MTHDTMETIGRGLRALLGTIALLGGSAGLLAETIHNLADAFTALPLGLAFILARREANRRFTYGYGRAEDVAGAVFAWAKTSARRRWWPTGNSVSNACTWPIRYINSQESER